MTRSGNGREPNLAYDLYSSRRRPSALIARRSITGRFGVINLIETLFALGGASILIAVVLWVRGRRNRARQFFIFGVLILAAAVVLEISVRL